MPTNSRVQKTQDDKKLNVRTKKKRIPGEQTAETKLPTLLKTPMDTAMRQQMAQNLQSAVGNRQVQRKLGGGGTGMLQLQGEGTDQPSPGLQADQQRLKDLDQLAEDIDRYAFHDYENLVRTVIHILTALSMIYDTRQLNNLNQEMEAWLGMPGQLERERIDRFTQLCFEIRELVRLYVETYEDYFRAQERGTPGMTRINRLSDLVTYESRADRILEGIREARLYVTVPGGTGVTSDQQQEGAGQTPTGSEEGQQQEQTQGQRR